MKQFRCTSYAMGTIVKTMTVEATSAADAERQVIPVMPKGGRSQNGQPVLVLGIKQIV